MFHVPEKFRIRHPSYPEGDATNGVFQFKGPDKKESAALRVIASNGMGWEHVSASFSHRCPTWAEMCAVKSLFWDAEDAVMQLHPPQSMWVNNHNYCLHLWRPMTVTMPLPPMYMVGIQALGELA